MDPRPLGLEWGDLGLDPWPVRGPSCAAGDVGPWSLGNAGNRRLRVGRRALGRLTGIGESDMTRTYFALLAVSAMVALSGCGNSAPQPQPSTIVIQPAQPRVAAVVAPTPPPPPQSELVPPPPPGSGPVVWQPGHWAYTGVAGNPWSWVSGEYVMPPPGEATWIPGQWQQTPDGTWMWVTGHWT